MNSNKIDHKNLLFFFPPIIEDDYYKYSQKQNTPLYIYCSTFKAGFICFLCQRQYSQHLKSFLTKFQPLEDVMKLLICILRFPLN